MHITNQLIRSCVFIKFAAYMHLEIFFVHELHMYCWWKKSTCLSVMSTSSKTCITHTGTVIIFVSQKKKRPKTKILISLQFLASFYQKMLLFDGQEGTFRTIKLRPKQPNCIVCGQRPEITELIDYQQFCGSRPDDKVVCHL